MRRAAASRLREKGGADGREERTASPEKEERECGWKGGADGVVVDGVGTPREAHLSSTVTPARAHLT
jgi:hypothetical protein